jgi:hypothetical protein
MIDSGIYWTDGNPTSLKWFDSGVLMSWDLDKDELIDTLFEC